VYAQASLLRKYTTKGNDKEIDRLRHAADHGDLQASLELQQRITDDQLGGRECTMIC
jgi:hypothetical protein